MPKESFALAVDGSNSRQIETVEPLCLRGHAKQPAAFFSSLSFVLIDKLLIGNKSSFRLAGKIYGATARKNSDYQLTLSKAYSRN
jgi:hypothetical protein